MTINVNDVEEAGKVKLSWSPASDGVEFTAVLDDPDGTSNTPTWQWSESDNQNSEYTDISGETSATYTRPDSATKKYLRVTATYTDAHVTDRTASATQQVEPPSYLVGYALEFNVNTSGGYECPTGDSAAVCVRVSRNVTPGDDIYYPASVKYVKDGTDRYPSRGKISYSLGGTDKNYFDIDPSTGDLLPKGPYGYEDKEKYSITIVAADAYGEDDEIELSVERSGSGTAPVVQGPRVIRYPENGTWVATFTGSFVDGREDDVGWIVGVQPGGGDGDFFRIDDDGVLHFIQPPDYEDPADDNGNNEYTFSIMAYDHNPPETDKVTDQGPARASTTLPSSSKTRTRTWRSAARTSVKFPENSTDAVATYTAQGAEGTLEWMLSGQDSNLFDINNNGELTFEQTPDYEKPFDASDPVDDRNDYLLSVTVTDGTDTKSRDPVRVMVTNVNEALCSRRKQPLSPSRKTRYREPTSAHPSLLTTRMLETHPSTPSAAPMPRPSPLAIIRVSCKPRRLSTSATSRATPLS